MHDVSKTGRFAGGHADDADARLGVYLSAENLHRLNADSHPPTGGGTDMRQNTVLSFLEQVDTERSVTNLDKVGCERASDGDSACQRNVVWMDMFKA